MLDIRMTGADDPRPFYAHQANLAENGTFFAVGDALSTRHAPRGEAYGPSRQTTVVAVTASAASTAAQYQNSG